MAPRSVAHLATLLIAGALVVSTLALAAPARASREDVLVVLAEGASPSDFLNAHGGGSYRQLDERTILFSTSDAAGLGKDRRVESVDADHAIREARASWDTASWDRASWDTASWDSASWDRASWDRASWDRASWDRASWDRASWDRASWDADTPDGSPSLATWGRDAIRAPATVPFGGATVCIVDSGIDANHPQLAPNLWRDTQGRFGIDLVDRDGSPDDVSGHGTHLAGIVTATSDGPMRGVGAPLVASARIFGAEGVGLTSALIEGIGWCTSIDAEVILLALTEDAPSAALRQSIARAQRAGSLVVASAGNAGPCSDCVSYPAAYPGVVAVGAIGPDGSVPAFSSTGSQLELVAPGARIVSTYPGGYRVGSGTSQAAAFAAGALALILAENAWQGGPAAAVALSQTALDLGRPGKDPLAGHGLIQLDAALERAGGPR